MIRVSYWVFRLDTFALPCFFHLPYVSCGTSDDECLVGFSVSISNEKLVDQRWRPGTRLPKVRAQGCSHAERSNLRNVKEFSQTKEGVRATETCPLFLFWSVRVDFVFCPRGVCREAHTQTA